MSFREWCRFRGSGKIAAILLAGAAAVAAGQTTQTPIQTTEQSTSIHGLVLNAKTNKPLARALVQVEGHSILTGYDGKFEFAGLSGTTTAVRVTKPGFYEGLDPYQTATQQAAVGSPDEVQVKLYPEALITGTVIAANGDPLTQIQVQALRRVDDESGSRWTMGGQASTNGDGQFRLPLPGGEYVVETQYMPERFGARGAVLPMMVPAAGSSGETGDGTSTMRLASGSEQHLDLHPPVRPSHAVHIQIDSSAGAAEGQFAPQIQVHLANGLVFSPGTRGADRPGEVVVNLPNGSYILSASTGGREDGASYGETRVIVADEDVAGVTIHLQKALELPVEASVDPASVETGTAKSLTVSSSGSAFDPALNSTDGSGINPGSASFVQQLGIFFQRTNAGASLRTENVSPAARRGGPVGFTLLPGRYRLRSAGYSQWFIESATAGGTDLLTQELVVDGGSSSVPLRLVVSNQTATIKGTTKLGGQSMGCAVYLIATAPSTAPVIQARSGSDGSFSRAQIPPGSYRVVAAETRLSYDLTDPAAQRQLAPYMKTVTVGAGETGSVDLDGMPASELRP